MTASAGEPEDAFDKLRDRFDGLLEELLAALPPALHELLEETPLVVDDVPDAAILEELGLDPLEEADALCGLHSGTPLTERSVLDEHSPEVIQLFRLGIFEEAGGDGATDDDIRREIRITLLHEIGHHFGLDEDDLERLGYA